MTASALRPKIVKIARTIAEHAPDVRPLPIVLPVLAAVTRAEMRDKGLAGIVPAPPLPTALAQKFVAEVFVKIQSVTHQPIAILLRINAASLPVSVKIRFVIQPMAMPIVLRITNARFAHAFRFLIAATEPVKPAPKRLVIANQTAGLLPAVAIILNVLPDKSVKLRAAFAGIAAMGYAVRRSVKPNAIVTTIAENRAMSHLSVRELQTRQVAEIFITELLQPVMKRLANVKPAAITNASLPEAKPCALVRKIVRESSGLLNAPPKVIALNA